MIRIIGIAAIALSGLLTVASGAWGALALTYSGLQSDVLRASLTAAYALAALAALIALGFRRSRWRALVAYLLLFALLVTWWRGIEPSNDRDWQADVARLPYATI